MKKDGECRYNKVVQNVKGFENNCNLKYQCKFDHK